MTDLSEVRRRAEALQHAHHALKGCMTALAAAALGDSNRHKVAALGAVAAAVGEAEKALRLVREQQ